MAIPNDPCFQIVLDLSTAHMPESDPDWGSLRVAVHEYGAVVFVLSDREDLDFEHEDEPEWIRPAMALARKHDCLLVNFDRDGEVCEDLPTWEW